MTKLTVKYPAGDVHALTIITYLTEIDIVDDDYIVLDSRNKITRPTEQPISW